MNTKTAVLISSCDRYSDLWEPFFSLFWRYWPDCPFPVFLGTNKEHFRDKRVVCIETGPDRGWSENLLIFLNSIKTKQIILFLEDFLIIETVNTAKVKMAIKLAYEEGLGCFRLRPAPPPSKPIRGLRNIGIVQRGEPYRISTQVAIWDIDFIKSIIRREFSVWEFEHYGTLIADRTPGNVWAVYDAIINYRHGVEKGRWLEDGVEICRTRGIKPDLSKRTIITGSELAIIQNKKERSMKVWLASRLHPAVRRFVRRFLPRPGLRTFLRG